MKLDEYQERSKRTLNFEGMEKKDCINQMLLGISGESGEISDHFKKVQYQGHQLDVDHVIEEIGDTMFYLAGLATVMDTSLSEIAEKNVDKLLKRYPNGFEVEKSVNREC